LTLYYVVQWAIPTGEPFWPYALLIVVHLLILTTGCGRNLGMDQLMVEKLANWPGKRSIWMKRFLSML
jgi:hypothetical protein